MQSQMLFVGLLLLTVLSLGGIALAYHQGHLPLGGDPASEPAVAAPAESKALFSMDGETELKEIDESVGSKYLKGTFIPDIPSSSEADPVWPEGEFKSVPHSGSSSSPARRGGSCRGR